MLTLGPVQAAPGRKVVLQGATNTRELGGIARVRHGMVYRSGALCSLTPSDVQTLKALKLRTIIDFRFERELAHAGFDNAELRKAVSYICIPIDNSHGLGRKEYRRMVRENDSAIHQIFSLLAKPGTFPVLYHCAGGKDRTGMVSALLLELCGASRKEILADYMLSERNRPSLIVRPSWLNEVFAAVDERGGIVRFLEHTGVTREELSSIRKSLMAGRAGSGP